MKDMITGKEISGESKTIPYYQGLYTETTEETTGVDTKTISTHYQVQTEPLELVVDQESWLQREKWAKFWKVYHIVLISLFVIGIIVMVVEPDIHVAFLVGPVLCFFIMFMSELLLLNFQAKKKGLKGVRGATVMDVFTSPSSFLVIQYRSTLDIDPNIKFFTEKESQKLNKEETVQ